MAPTERDRRPLDDDARADVEGWVRDLAPRLMAYVRRTYGSAVDAEEVVAETFCRAAARIEALRRCQGPELYLFRIARNLCRDYFRRRRTEGGALRRLEAAPRTDPPADESASRGEALEQVRRALWRLPEAEREVVVLRVSAGLKFQEIAELLEIPLGTALSRMHHALERLRGLVEGSREHA